MTGVLYSQAIRARHGAAAHVIVMTFALVTNVVISGMVMTQGVNILTSLTDGKRPRRPPHLAVISPHRVTNMRRTNIDIVIIYKTMCSHVYPVVNYNNDLHSLFIRMTIVDTSPWQDIYPFTWPRKINCNYNRGKHHRATRHCIYY